MATTIEAAAAPALSPTIASELLSELGFLHVPGPPLSASRAYLLVAIRRQPTLRHFDPERIDYWQTIDGRGASGSLDRRSRPPAKASFAWGGIRLVDRLNVVNDYVTFGGVLAAARAPAALVAVFSSPAPILASGGHSQGWDPVAKEVLGYLARLRAAAGQGRALERRLAEMAPLALYSAFVDEALARYEAADRLVPWRPQTLALLRAQARRLRNDAADDWASGEVLARDLR
jgi:hypothetical protein